MKIRFILFVSVLLINCPAFCLDKPVLDSIKPKHPQIIAYQFNRSLTSLDSIAIDTTLKNFQIFHKPFSEKALNVFLGTFPQPYNSVIFTNRKEYQDFLFSQYLEYTFHQPEEMIYYKAWSPFTELTYYTGGPKNNQEQKLNIIHTQNVSKNFNVGFLGDLNSGHGYYTNQNTKSNCFTLYADYKGSRYSIYGSITSNTYKGKENGGIRNESAYLSGDEPATIPVNLENANTITKRQTIFFQHRFYITGSYKSEDTVRRASRWNEVLSLIHQFKFDRYTHDYTDNLETVSSSNNYADKYFYSYPVGNFTTYVRDSSFFRRYENTFQLAINAHPWLKVPAELRFGIKNQMDKIKYGALDAKATLFNLTSKSLIEKNYFNNAFVGSLTNRFSKTLHWDATAEIYFTGYKLGNTEITGEIEKTIKNNLVLKLSGRLANTKPGYFMNEYSSAFQSWSNSLPNQQTATVHAGIYLKKYKLYLDGQIDNYNNFVYFGTDAKPTSAGKPFSVQSLTASKQIDWGIFHTDTRLTFQRSGDENAVQIPNFSMFHSTYLKFTWFKVLTISPGFSVFYNSAFYSNAYMPETGIFYTQKEKKIGDYPYTDVFLNVKLKRFRFFIRYDRINTLLSNSQGFYLPQYPFNPSTIKYGLSWTFYD